MADATQIRWCCRSLQIGSAYIVMFDNDRFQDVAETLARVCQVRGMLTGLMHAQRKANNHVERQRRVAWLRLKGLVLFLACVVYALQQTTKTCGLDRSRSSLSLMAGRDCCS